MADQYNPGVPRRVLALFAKAPVPGQVKTRLVPPLLPEEAAALYEVMLLDILDQHAADAVELALWHAPPEAADWFRRRAPARYRIRAQTGADLASRMAHLFEVHEREGFDRIVLRGTDSPTLPAERVSAAFESLERSDLVLCPDRDGGYNLIGLRRACAPLFELAMSTASVLRETLARARRENLSTALLPPCYDVDTAADLGPLRADVSVERTPRTLRWLESARDRVSP
jgi:rSAM/selenodomain-associated transferase 1